MSDEFRRLQPGVKFRPSATAWNTMLDVAREYRVNNGFSQNGIDTSQDGRFWIQNDGVDELPQYSIVGVGEALTLPVDDEGEFLSTMGFGSIEPTTGDRFAIIQDGVESGTIVEARITGLSHCYVNRADTTHMMASAETANYDTLIAAESGQAEIIWMDDVPAAAVGETIHEGTGVPGSGLGSDGDYYKDTAASEYYGPKATGAWGSAFAYGTGTCWAVVVLDQFDANTQGITSINGETGPEVTLESAGGTVIITEPSANVVNFEIDTPFVVGVGAVVDSADVCDGAGTYSPIVYGGAVVDSKDTCAGVGVYTPPTFTGDGAVVDSADVLSVAASYTGFELFVAEMTAPIQQVSSGRWIYAWIEQTISPASGDYVDMPEGRSGDTISGPFMRERNDTLTCTPVYSLVRQRGNFGGQRLYDFEHCCTTGSVIGTGSLIDTVDTVEGVGEVTPTGSIGGGSVIDTADTCDGVATVDPVGFVGYGPLIDTVDLADGVATITPTGFVGAGALIDTVDTCAGVGYLYSNSDFTSEGGIAIGGVYQTMADIPVQGGIAIGGTI